MGLILCSATGSSRTCSWTVGFGFGACSIAGLVCCGIVSVVGLILGFVANALLKFIWSYRLFGYCAIMMAAVPNNPEAPDAMPRAHAAAQVNIHAARNFNIGLRAVYFAIGSAGWLLGPLGLVAGTVLVTSMTLRREFTSASRQAIMDDVP